MKGREKQHKFLWELGMLNEFFIKVSIKILDNSFKNEEKF